MTDIHGADVYLPQPLSVRIRMEEDVPADDLYAVFPDTAVGELCGVTVFDADQIVFRGIVDEQERIVRTGGAYLRIAARSLAAHLLDNEAPPCSYDHPSARLIYERHVKKYGISAGDPDDAAYFGELTIPKGMSQWGVVSAFSRACCSGVPRVSADGVLYLKGAPCERTVIFGGRGIPYIALTDSRRRCEEISRVHIKMDPDGGYGYHVENSDALSRGIVRERYLNAMHGGQTIKSADIMLEKSRRSARTLSLRCVGRHTLPAGCGAVVADLDIGDGFYVSAVQYRMDSKGEYTDVKLRRRAESCGYHNM